MKIIHLKIKNYRGISNLEHHFGDSMLICLIGRGDSGKTTILEAINAVLSPRWNKAFNDDDFHERNIEKPIEIEVTIANPPDDLLIESKFGLYIKGLDSDGRIHEELGNGHQPVLTVRLEVSKDLEPSWHVTSGRVNQEYKEIRSSDRAKFQMHMVSDYTDRHFSWAKGNILYSLLGQDGPGAQGNSTVLDALREAKDKIDEEKFSHLEDATDRVVQSAAKFGIDISGITSSIDFRELSSKDGRISLHDGATPFKLKGKGSKRLISIAIQTELSKSGGILLVDEVEQGLEPDRVQHLIQTLKNENQSQVIITTHSRDAIVELQAIELFRIIDSSRIIQFDGSWQGMIRSNPEALLCPRVIVAEGLTEIGILRAMNKWRIENDFKSMAIKGIRYADGSGSNQIDRTIAFYDAKYNVCLFCDSDRSDLETPKNDLRAKEIAVFDCEENLAIEQQIFKDLPWDAILELIKYREAEIDNSVDVSLSVAYMSLTGNSLPPNWRSIEPANIRKSLGSLSCKKSSEWFKRIDHGEVLGQICFKYWDQIKSTHLGIMLNGLQKWIDHV